MTADERFLSRWSRLKKDARQTEAAPAPKPEASPPPPATPAPVGEAPVQAVSPAPELPPIDSLKGLASDYTEFLKPGIDDGLRRAALKKLFSDPYFETFEKFAEYCEDYTQSEPIPPAMLKTLEQAKGLLFDAMEEDKKKEEAGELAVSPQALPEAPGQTDVKPEASTATSAESAPQPEKKI